MCVKPARNGDVWLTVLASTPETRGTQRDVDGSVDEMMWVRFDVGDRSIGYAAGEIGRAHV